MDYERIASDAILETCAERRADFLRNALERARAAIATWSPRDAFRIPAGQRDAAGAARLAALLAEHGVELRAAPNGDVYVPLAQPYGRFANELLTAQRYPETKLVPGKDIVRPVRRLGLDAAAHDGRDRGAGGAARGARALEGRRRRPCRSRAPPSPSPPAARRRRGS